MGEGLSSVLGEGLVLSVSFRFFLWLESMERGRVGCVFLDLCVEVLV